jgi:ABC-type transporter Mla maintaining outer membrane lipid asymmetry ATPase subunit MlaF
MHLACQQLTHQFDPRMPTPVHNVEIPVHSVIGLFGPSGSGKTTLLKMLTGLLKPTTGHVTWNHTPIEQLPIKTRAQYTAQLGMVFQNDALFDSMSVFENVCFPLRRRGFAIQEATELTYEALSHVQLPKSAFQKSIPQLSGGMKKRVGLARALVQKPQVLLCDDALAGLDTTSEVELATLIQTIFQGTLIIAAPRWVSGFQFTQEINLA